MNRGWERIICCASGPSFSPEQAAMVMAAQGHGWRVIVVNNQYRTVPTADALYAADGPWWGVHIAEVRATFRGELWTQDSAASDKYGLRWVRSIPGNALPDDPMIIMQGGNGGYQALSLAARFGARRIVLCGYDMRREPHAKHNHPDHKPPLSNGNPDHWRKHFTTLARDLAEANIAVVNASLSALQCFPCEPLEDALGMAVTA